MKKIFYLDESASIPGKYMISIKHDEFFCSYTEGSYHILQARVLGLSYANYLRLCRDECGAVIYGKNTKYPVAYFNNDKNAQSLVRLLNKYAESVLWERDNPNFEAQQAELAAYKREHWV